MSGRTRLAARLVAATVGLMLVVPAAPAAAAPTAVLETSMTGDAEVPGPGDDDGFGVAKISINVPKKKVCFTLVVVDITLPATAAHIHPGAAGVAGAPVVTLGTPEEIGGSGIGLATGCVTDQSKAVLRDIRRSPDQFYVNVHNADFPDGALRGQLAPAA
jgi:hypothetical protein